MTSRKSFTVAREGAQPVTFDVDGEEFTAVPSELLPGGALLDVAAAHVNDDAASRVTMIATFLDAVLVPESAKRFAARMRDPEHPITLEAAADVMTWLVEEVYVGHPTIPSSSSSAGSSSTGRGSTDGVSSEASTPSLSAVGG